MKGWERKSQSGRVFTLDHKGEERIATLSGLVGKDRIANLGGKERILSRAYLSNA